MLSGTIKDKRFGSLRISRTCLRARYQKIIPKPHIQLQPSKVKAQANRKIEYPGQLPRRETKGDFVQLDGKLSLVNMPSPRNGQKAAPGPRIIGQNLRLSVWQCKADRKHRPVHVVILVHRLFGS